MSYITYMKTIELGPGNSYGVWTLYKREVLRFIKIYTQTIVAPVVTTLLFLAIFTLALGRSVQTVAGVPFIEFLAPGLIMMSIIQNSFANTSSAIVISKVQGNIVDTMMPPFTANELTLAFSLGGATRGVMVGMAVAVVIGFFAPIHIYNFGIILFYAVSAALMLSLLGVISGIWSEKFDHIAAVTNFIVMPLSFLSGTFYSIDRLNGFFNTVAHFDPFFYAIDGFRNGFIGHSDAPLLIGVAVMVGVNSVLWLVCQRMFATGYKLKA